MEQKFWGVFNRLLSAGEVRFLPRSPFKINNLAGSRFLKFPYFKRTLGHANSVMAAKGEA
jgi:hypothetical protein